MLNSTIRAFALLATTTVTLAGSFLLSADASAQGRGRGPVGKQRPPIGRTNNQVRTLIDRTERESNALRNSFERRYSEYRLNRLPAGERAKENVQEMDQAFERLRGVADDTNVSRARDEMRKVVRQAEDVDRIFGNHPEIVAVVRGQWRDLREDINRLAKIYGIPGLGWTGSRR